MGTGYQGAALADPKLELAADCVLYMPPHPEPGQGSMAGCTGNRPGNAIPFVCEAPLARCC